MIARFGDWMQTFTGRQFWPLDPRPDEIAVEDIAHALAMQCRYAGHCLRFYSVAEHSVLLSEWVMAEAGTHAALWALLHDASEAYLVDVPRPVKPYLAGYKPAEAVVMRAVAARFGLAPDIPAIVKQADDRIIADERANLSACVAQWDFDAIPLGVTLHYWTPDVAEERFLEAFRWLIDAVDVDRCIACDMPFKDGDAVYDDVSGGSLHAACCGPEVESYVDAAGEPLKPGEAIPAPYIWRAQP